MSYWILIILFVRNDALTVKQVPVSNREACVQAVEHYKKLPFSTWNTERFDVYCVPGGPSTLDLALEKVK